MDNSQRLAISFIAGTLVDQNNPSSVYDYQTASYSNYSGQVDEDRINIYDYSRRCYITGNNNGYKYSLYDYGAKNYVDFEIEEDGKFKGYDYFSRKYYSGYVRSRNISFYDYETSAYYNFSV
jgi:hypothetical protein